MILFVSCFLYSSTGIAVREQSTDIDEDASKRLTRSVVVTELADAGDNYVRNLNQFLYPSWSYVNGITTSDNVANGIDSTTDMKVIADLVIFYELEVARKYPTALPLACENLEGPLSSGSIGKTRGVGKCFVYPLPVNYTSPYVGAGKYRFLTSLAFMELPAFRSLMAYYDYVLRTDTDAVLTPALRTYIPPNGWSFGVNMMGVEYTMHRLERLAKALNLPPRVRKPRHDMGSTFYIGTSRAYQFGSNLVNLTRYIHESQFTKDRCQLEKDEFMRSFVCKDPGVNCSADSVNICRWPFWNEGVSSLYATDILANAYAPSEEWKEAPELDISMGRGDLMLLNQSVHIHVLNHADHTTEVTRFEPEKPCTETSVIPPLPQRATDYVRWVYFRAQCEALKSKRT